MGRGLAAGWGGRFSSGCALETGSGRSSDGGKETVIGGWRYEPVSAS